MSRNYTIRALTDDHGNPLAEVWCRAFNVTTGALVETEYTDATGVCTFTTLPDDANVNICCVRGTLVKWFYNIFAAGQDLMYNTITANHVVAGSITVTEIDFTPYIIGTNTQDDIVNGATRGNVLLTHLSAGKIKLTSSAVYDGKWYYDGNANAGISLEAGVGINIWGRNNAFITRATETGTIQCYVGSNGYIYAGGGNIYLYYGGLVIGSAAGEIASCLFKRNSDGLQMGSIWANGAGFNLLAVYGNLYLKANAGSIIIDASAVNSMSPSTNGYIEFGDSSHLWEKVWTTYINQVIQNTATQNTMYDIVPYNTVTWFGNSGNKINRGYFDSLPTCPDGMPSVESGIAIIKKIKKPQLSDGFAGERYYYKDIDFPDEMKVSVLRKRGAKQIIEDTGEKEACYIKTIGVLVNSVAELVEKVEALEARK